MAWLNSTGGWLFWPWPPAAPAAAARLTELGADDEVMLSEAGCWSPIICDAGLNTWPGPGLALWDWSEDAVLLVNLELGCTVTGLTETGELSVWMLVVGMSWGTRPWLPIRWVPLGVWTMVWKNCCRWWPPPAMLCPWPVSLVCTSILYPGGRKVLKPTISSGCPLNNMETREMTPGVSMDWDLNSCKIKTFTDRAFTWITRLLSLDKNYKHMRLQRKKAYSADPAVQLFWNNFAMRTSAYLHNIQKVIVDLGLSSELELDLVQVWESILNLQSLKGWGLIGCCSCC